MLEADEKLVGWKMKRQTSHLHAHADRFEKGLVAAVEIAAMAMEEAERAAIRAVLARREAISIQIQRPEHPHS
jgi:hypothetical protein